MIYLENTDCLLFQGDSITHGGRVASDWDMNHVIGHGYQDYVAQTLGVDNIERNPRIENRGVSGDRIERITARMKSDIIDIKPTVMSILDGVNDAHSFINGDTDISPEKYSNLYRALLDRALEALPGLKLIICQPFSYSDNMRIIEDMRKRADYTEQIARDYGAVFVKFWDELDKYVPKAEPKQIIWDGIHPTYVGHGILARCWLEQVEKSQKFNKKQNI